MYTAAEILSFGTEKDGCIKTAWNLKDSIDGSIKPKQYISHCKFTATCD